MDEVLKERLLKDTLFVNQVRIVQANLTYELRPLFDQHQDKAREVAIKLVRSINIDRMWVEAEVEERKRLFEAMRG